MVQLNTWDRTEYPPDGSPGFDLDIQAALQSFSGRTVQSFASTAARDAAFAALTTSQQKNHAVCGVVGLGLFYWTGTAWRPVMSDDQLVQKKIQNITPQPTGICRIGFPIPFATGSTPGVVVHHATASANAPILNVRLYTAASYLDYTQFHIHVMDNAGNNYSNALDITWVAVGTRAAE